MLYTVIIPTDRLSKEALSGLIEEFISREGTDYGLQEYDLAQKTKHVEVQLARGEVLVVFDAASDSCNLLPAEEARLATLAASREDDLD